MAISPMSGRTASLFVCLALVASHVPAQGFTLFFSTDGTEVAGNGTGGSASNPGNFASVFPDECVLAVTPGATASATPIATRSFYSTWFGDHDGDGDFTQGVIGNLDAVHVPANAPNPPSIFDIFVSFSRDIGPGGFQSAGMLRDGDVLRLRPQGGAQLFISEAQVTQAMGTTADIDVNGFTIDPVTGDIFWTMTTTQVVGGLTLNDGGLVRLPASSYVANADGTVASVTPNSAQIALFENELDVMYTNAGLGTVGDLDGIAIDPAGGTFTTVGGQTLPHLWFAADSSTAGASIVSSRNMGSIATRNAELLGIYFPIGHQHIDHETLQIHRAPHCFSDLLFNGALKETARNVYMGIIKVHPDAQKTDAFQRNGNLILDNTARADSIPGLEIEADDVRCTHAATAAQVEDEYVFYLMARGLTRPQAERMIVQGFFQAVLDRVPVESVVTKLEQVIERKIGG